MKGQRNWLGRSETTELTCITPVQRKFFEEVRVIAVNGSVFTAVESNSKSIMQMAKNEVKGLTDPEGFHIVVIVFGVLVFLCLIILLIIHYFIQLARKPFHMDVNHPSSTKALMNSSKANENVLQFQNDSDIEEEEMDIKLE